MAHRLLSAAVAARQRSPSPDFNPSSDPATQQQRQQQSTQMQIVIPYRKMSKSVLCRDYNNDEDVDIPQSSFVTDSNFKSMTPGFAIYRQTFAQGSIGHRVALSTQTMPECVTESFSCASNIGKTVVIFTVNSKRYQAPFWAFPTWEVSPRVSIEHSVQYHFIALPPVSFDMSVPKTKQAPLPLIFKVHRKTGDCFTKSDPRHWDDDAVEMSMDRLF